MDSNGNEISSARDMEGEANSSRQTVETGENDNNRKRTLEGPLSNVPMNRFKIMSTEDQFKLLLPEEMAEYENDHLQTFLSEKRVHDSILMENPIPSNADQPQKVDDFIVLLMSKNETAVDLLLEKVQQKIANVMGPLTRVWKALEDVKNYLIVPWGSSYQFGEEGVAFGAGLPSSDLPRTVQCSLLSHERLSKTETHFVGESRFTFRGAEDVIWR